MLYIYNTVQVYAHISNVLQICKEAGWTRYFQRDRQNFEKFNKLPLESSFLLGLQTRVFWWNCVKILTFRKKNNLRNENSGWKKTIFPSLIQVQNKELSRFSWLCSNSICIFFTVNFGVFFDFKILAIICLLARSKNNLFYEKRL